MVVVDDTNGDGSTDDEVTERAIAAYENGIRLLYMHLVDTDRTLHAYGPYSGKSHDSAARADALIGRMVSRFRKGTMLIVVADHGGHDVEGGRGDHGSLLPQDMLIPLAVSLC
jgi:predicted AlkP superfamily pyrophosphatase or phosphodiesterase